MDQPTARVQRLADDAAEAAQVRGFLTHPDVVALRVERVRTQVDRLMWTGIVLGLSFTMVNVQTFAAGGAATWSLPWLVAWLLDPMVSLVLIAVLRAEQVTARYQVPTGVWARVAKWGTLAATYVMNTWASYVAGSPSAVVLHSVPPLVVFVAAEAVTDLRDKLTESVYRAADTAAKRMPSSVTPALDSPAAPTEGAVPANPPATHAPAWHATTGPATLRSGGSRVAPLRAQDDLSTATAWAAGHGGGDEAASADQVVSRPVLPGHSRREPPGPRHSGSGYSPPAAAGADTSDPADQAAGPAQADGQAADGSATPQAIGPGAPTTTAAQASARGGAEPSTGQPPADDTPTPAAGDRRADQAADTPSSRTAHGTAPPGRNSAPAPSGRGPADGRRDDETDYQALLPAIRVLAGRDDWVTRADVIRVTGRGSAQASRLLELCDQRHPDHPPPRPRRAGHKADIDHATRKHLEIVR